MTSLWGMTRSIIKPGSPGFNPKPPHTKNPMVNHLLILLLATLVVHANLISPHWSQNSCQWMMYLNLTYYFSAIDGVSTNISRGRSRENILLMLAKGYLQNTYKYFVEKTEKLDNKHSQPAETVIHSQKIPKRKGMVRTAGGEKEKTRDGSHQQHYLLFESLESPSPPLVPPFHFKERRK